LAGVRSDRLGANAGLITAIVAGLVAGCSAIERTDLADRASDRRWCRSSIAMAPTPCSWSRSWPPVIVAAAWSAPPPGVHPMAGGRGHCGIATIIFRRSQLLVLQAARNTAFVGAGRRRRVSLDRALTGIVLLVVSDGDCTIRRSLRPVAGGRRRHDQRRLPRHACTVRCPPVDAAVAPNTSSTGQWVVRAALAVALPDREPVVARVADGMSDTRRHDPDREPSPVKAC
jgi:hypothetical protein